MDAPDTSPLRRHLIVPTAHAVTVVTLAISAMSACGSPSPTPATCKSAIAQTRKVSPVTGAESVVGMTPAMRKLSESTHMKMLAATLHTCSLDPWDQEVLRCITAATDAAGVSVCMARLTPDQSLKLAEAVRRATADDIAALAKAWAAAGLPAAPAEEEPTPP